MPRYDVFLSHASADQPDVERLARKLLDAGIKPFFDKWHLVPGKRWISGLNKALVESASLAVLIGPGSGGGGGAWRMREVEYALARSAREDSFGVIPVILPGGNERAIEELSGFLELLTWVDFRNGLADEDAFRNLVAGIRGEEPGPGVGEEPHSLLNRYRCIAPARELFVQRGVYVKVRDTLLAERTERGTTVGITTAIHGAGGFGKTALAIELCYDERVREHYPDGILWTTMGDEIDAASRLARVRDLIRWWTEKDPPAFETVSAASAHLHQELNGKRVLLVVDDVWRPEDVTPFQGLGSRAALLVTTRDSRTLPTDSVPVHVDAMETSEAVQMLGTGLPAGAEAELETLAARLGEWPLLLKLVNRQVESWTDKGLDLREAIRRAESALKAKGLTYFDPKDTKDRSQASSLTLEVSLERLSQEERERFTQLAIFPEDTNVPLRILEKLWQLDSFDVEELASRLFDLSLLRSFDLHSGTIRLHDVIRAYLLKKGESHLVEWHRRLLDAYRPANGRWSDLPREESYLWNHLFHHLMGAGQSDICRGLLLDSQYLQSKLETTDVNALLADFSAFAEKAQELRLVRDALRLSAHVLIKRPDLIREQLWGRLLDCKEVSIQRLLKERPENSSGHWLRPREASLSKPGGFLFRTIDHPDVVLSMALLGRDQLVSGADETLRLWDLEKGTIIKTFHQSARIYAVALLGSRRVAIGTQDGLLKILDIESGSPLHILQGHSAQINSIAIQGSELIVSGSDDRTVRVWDLESSRCARVFEHSGRVNALLFVGKGKLASGSNDGSLRILDLEENRFSVVERQFSGVNALATVDGRMIVSGSNDGALRIWDLDRGNSQRVIKRFPGKITRLGVLGSCRVVSGHSDGMLRVWDLENGELLREINGHSSWVSALIVLGDGRVVTGSDGALRIWNLDDQSFEPIEGHAKRISRLVKVGEDCVASASEDHTLRVWDTKNSHCIRTLKGHSAGVYALGLLDKEKLVSVASDGSLKVWDSATGETLGDMKGRFGLVLSLGVVDARQIVLGSGNEVLLIEVETERVIRIFAGHSALITSLEIVDSRRLVSSSFDETIRVWDLHSGEVLRVLAGHAGPVNAIAVLPGGLLLSGSHDGILRIWSAESGQVLQVLEGHSDWVTCVAPLDYKHVVSGSEDGSIRVWDLARGDTLCSFALDEPVASLVAIASSQTIIAGDAAGRIHFFDLIRS